MNANLFPAVIALSATAAHAADTLTKDEIAKLPFVGALAYAEAIDVYCFPDWHSVTADLAAAAVTQAGLQNMSFVESGQTLETPNLLKRDQSACGPAMAFVDRVAATIPEMRPRMAAMLTALRKEEAERKAAQARAARIAQCSGCRHQGEGFPGGALVTGEWQLRGRTAPLYRRPLRDT